MDKAVDGADEGALFDVACPECDYHFRLEDPEVGEVIQCGDCLLNLKVTEVNAASSKVVLELTKTRSEDWGQ